MGDRFLRIWVVHAVCSTSATLHTQPRHWGRHATCEQTTRERRAQRTQAAASPCSPGPGTGQGCSCCQWWAVAPRTCSPHQRYRREPGWWCCPQWPRGDASWVSHAACATGGGRSPPGGAGHTHSPQVVTRSTSRSANSNNSSTTTSNNNNNNNSNNNNNNNSSGSIARYGL